MNVETLLDALNDRYETRCRLIGRFGGGEGSGAWELRDDDGSLWALKLFEGNGIDPSRAAETTSHLRRIGYPAPATRLIGEIDSQRFAITERLPGAPLSELDDPQIERAIELVDLQRGVALADARRWPDWLVGTVVDGQVGYCEHESLRNYSPITTVLLEHLRRVASQHAVETPSDDVVHFDFTAANMIAERGRVTGVIDWDGTVTGDAAFDLVTQALYAYQPHRRDRLLEAARVRTHPAALRLYAAHMVLRQIDWSIRHHDVAVTEFFTDLSSHLLVAVDAAPNQL